LRRRLEKDGITFQSLLDDVRRQEAVRLLDEPTLSVAAIAERLGYSEPRSFRHAYRRWTGKTPRAGAGSDGDACGGVAVHTSDSSGRRCRAE
jgi:AraC-like DNA-binding protein